MLYELVHTSAPRGVEAGRSGYCTVACTKILPKHFRKRLEELVGFVVPDGISDQAAMPIAFRHYQIDFWGTRCSLLARETLPERADHTGRRARFSHVVLVEHTEDFLDHLCTGRAGNPAAMIAPSREFFRTSWDGDPEEIATEKKLRAVEASGFKAETWGRVTGDAGWAGVLAASFFETPGGHPVLVGYDSGSLRPDDVLFLVEEALALLPPEKRWDVTFSTYFTEHDKPEVRQYSCLWRFALQQSRIWRQRGLGSNAMRIDLSAPGAIPAEYMDHPLVQSARSGTQPDWQALATAAAVLRETPSGAGETEPTVADNTIRIRPGLPAPPPPPPPSHSALGGARTAPHRTRSKPRPAWPVALASIGGTILLAAIGFALYLRNHSPAHRAQAERPDRPPVVISPNDGLGNPTEFERDTERPPPRAPAESNAPPAQTDVIPPPETNGPPQVADVPPPSTRWSVFPVGAGKTVLPLPSLRNIRSPRLEFYDGNLVKLVFATKVESPLVWSSGLRSVAVEEDRVVFTIPSGFASPPLMKVFDGERAKASEAVWLSALNSVEAKAWEEQGGDLVVTLPEDKALSLLLEQLHPDRIRVAIANETTTLMPLKLDHPSKGQISIQGFGKIGKEQADRHAVSANAMLRELKKCPPIDNMSTLNRALSPYLEEYELAGSRQGRLMINVADHLLGKHEQVIALAEEDLQKKLTSTGEKRSRAEVQNRESVKLRPKLRQYTEYKAQISELEAKIKGKKVDEQAKERMNDYEKRVAYKKDQLLKFLKEQGSLNPEKRPPNEIEKEFERLLKLDPVGDKKAADTEMARLNDRLKELEATVVALGAARSSLDRHTESPAAAFELAVEQLKAYSSPVNISELFKSREDGNQRFKAFVASEPFKALLSSPPGSGILERIKELNVVSNGATPFELVTITRPPRSAWEAGAGGGTDGGGSSRLQATTEPVSSTL